MKEVDILPLDKTEPFSGRKGWTARSGVSSPPREWISLIKWKYVNLSEVLDSAHTTELDPKRTHVIDDEVELAFRVSKSSADHNIAFGMYINATAFVFPQRRDEFAQYQTHLSQLESIRLNQDIIRESSSLIERSAVRNQIAMQREFRLSDYSKFDHLRTPFCPLLGLIQVPSRQEELNMGPNKGDKRLVESGKP